MDSSIYSIGHGNKDIKEFLKELKSFNIEYLFDVRSKPYSRFNHFYNQNVLEFELLQNDITYVFVGELLGGLPNDIECYTNGKADYNKIKSKPFFIQGIEILVGANNEGWKVAMMCSETKPEQCHRSKLIGDVLKNYNISVNHIINCDLVRDQQIVMDEITKGKNTQNLFGDKLNLTSKNNY